MYCQICIAREEDIPMIMARKLSKNPVSDEVVSMAKEWFNGCIDTHQEEGTCPQLQVAPLPTRIIHISSENGRIRTRLHTSKADKCGVWVALSHCWGTPQNEERTHSSSKRPPDFSATVANAEELGSTIPADKLPRTIYDAVVFTQLLGYSYLCVDRLWILQDDAEDWKREAVKMQEYYNGSVLTIAADSSELDYSGFLARREPLEHFSDITVPLTPRRDSPYHGKLAFIDKRQYPLKRSYSYIKKRA
ncbi:hypothetical protein K402DRAFT_401293 [Aulographum hederae CBS 113979]|uniref:Heterokaryon incompatibility domain-containing protein n=1 Tax=Aulographum hederae CBS 113979 TaxID=1176131 RepID=A0A6G1HB59_9PEZI|nr:hypothetical protein K402DRAFT_401293 [Aulographum hederae CBS 113979]